MSHRAKQITDVWWNHWGNLLSEIKWAMCLDLTSTKGARVLATFRTTPRDFFHWKFRGTFSAWHASEKYCLFRCSLRSLKTIKKIDQKCVTDRQTDGRTGNIVWTFPTSWSQGKCLPVLWCVCEGKTIFDQKCVTDRQTDRQTGKIVWTFPTSWSQEKMLYTL